MSNPTTNKTKSSVINSVVFYNDTEQVALTFNSRTEPYIYDVLEGHYDSVVQAFNTTDSLGKTYHELVNKNLITATIS